MEINKTTVKISGIEYTICGYEAEEYMHKVATYVDKKMNEVRKNCFSLDNSMVAVLTAVNIADETLKLYDRVDELEKQVEQLKADIKSNRKK